MSVFDASLSLAPWPTLESKHNSPTANSSVSKPHTKIQWGNTKIKTKCVIKIISSGNVLSLAACYRRKGKTPQTCRYIANQNKQTHEHILMKRNTNYISFQEFELYFFIMFHLLLDVTIAWFYMTPRREPAHEGGDLARWSHFLLNNRFYQIYVFFIFWLENIWYFLSKI